MFYRVFQLAPKEQQRRCTKVETERECLKFITSMLINHGVMPIQQKKRFSSTPEIPMIPPQSSRPDKFFSRHKYSVITSVKVYQHVEVVPLASVGVANLLCDGLLIVIHRMTGL